MVDLSMSHSSSVNVVSSPFVAKFMLIDAVSPSKIGKVVMKATRLCNPSVY
jgi:hypothetical protein